MASLIFSAPRPAGYCGMVEFDVTQEGGEDQVVRVRIQGGTPDPFFIAGSIEPWTSTLVSDEHKAIVRALGVVDPKQGRVEVPFMLLDRFRAHLVKLGAQGL